MDIEKFKEEKQKLSKQITFLVNEFVENTHITIRGIEIPLIDVSSMGGGTQIVANDIILKIEI